MVREHRPHLLEDSTGQGQSFPNRAASRHVSAVPVSSPACFRRLLRVSDLQGPGGSTGGRSSALTTYTGARQPGGCSGCPRPTALRIPGDVGFLWSRRKSPQDGSRPQDGSWLAAKASMKGSLTPQKALVQQFWGEGKGLEALALDKVPETTRTHRRVWELGDKSHLRTGMGAVWGGKRSYPQLRGPSAQDHVTAPF